MSSTLGPRFGIWAPYRGKWVVNLDQEKHDASFALTKEAVLSAERSGYDTVLIAQHTINPQSQEKEILEAWTAAAAVAALTERIEIIAAIKPRLYHPAVLAKLALGIEDISNGRFAINFVNAWFKPELEKSGIGFPLHDDRYAYGEEWLQIVKRLISGETVTWEGENFTIQDYSLRPVSRSRQRPVIYAGGESEPARVSAAKLADAWFINGQPLHEVEALIQDVSRRPRTGEPIRFALSGFALSRATEKEAKELLDTYIRMNTPIDQEKFLKNVDPEARMFATAKKYPALIGANGGVAPGFIGSHDQVAERLLQFHLIGIETFMLSFHPLIEDQELFAQEVIPRVRRLIKKGL